MLTERGREGEKMSVFRSAKPNRIARIDYSKRYKIRPRINRAMFYANSLSNAMDLPSPGHLSHFENRGLNAEEIAYEQWHEIRITLCDHHALQRSLCSRPSFNEQPTPCITATLIIYFRWSWKIEHSLFAFLVLFACQWFQIGASEMSFGVRKLFINCPPASTVWI